MSHDANEPASQTIKSEPKQKPTHRRPTRRRPKDNKTEALLFISVAIEHLQRKGEILNKRTLLQLRTLFRNYCSNTGLRGKQKEAVWTQVSLLIQLAKESVTNDEQEL